MRNTRFLRLNNEETMEEERLRKDTRWYMGLATALVLLAILLFPSGCSKLLPTVPVNGEDQVQGYPAEELWPKPPAKLAGWLEPCSALDAMWFDEKGGKLKLEANCFKKLEFKVKKNALSDSVLITVGVNLFNYCRDEEMQKGFMLEFAPDGVVFNKPAELKVEVRDVDKEDSGVLRLYWYNPGTGLWEVEQEVVITGNKKKAKFDIYHFSRYAISR
jgi:hypothetical protein